MLAIFAVIIGGIVTGRLLVGWRLACPLRGASSLRGCCGGVFAAALCLRTKAEMRTKLPFPRGRP